MAAITAAMVGELRAKTDAPMMECKKALTEADGDMARAEEILRVKLGSKAGKAASRVTAEGIVASFIDGTTGALLEVNCETDFVSKNDDFLAFTNECVKMIAEKNPADVAALLALPMNGSTVDEVRSALIGKIGENIMPRRFKRFTGSNKLVSYLHGARIGVMVEFEGDETAAKDVAMHIAAMKPVALSMADVPAEAIAIERSVAVQKAAESGKPPEIVEKMVEALMGDDAFGINPVTIDAMVAEIAQVVSSGVELAIVIGGGNIFRGVAGGAAGMDRATADYMGMLATMMNSLALQDALRQKGVEARVQSALRMDQVVEPYIRPRAIRAMSEGKVVIFAAGTGNPFFTTDTAAALRGAEMGVEIMLKATKVDGIYSADPVKDPTATLYKTITFDEALIKNLQVMDATAFALCRDRKLPIKVFSILKPGALMRVVRGEPEGTLVHV